MEISEFYADLENAMTDAHIPTAHNVFLQRMEPPYLLYRDSFDHIAANSRNVLKKHRIIMELYAAQTDADAAEEAVEAFLDGFTTYSKDRTFDDEQQLSVTYYQFYIV